MANICNESCYCYKTSKLFKIRGVFLPIVIEIIGFLGLGLFIITIVPVFIKFVERNSYENIPNIFFISGVLSSFILILYSTLIVSLPIMIFQIIMLTLILILLLFKILSIYHQNKSIIHNRCRETFHINT